MRNDFWTTLSNAFTATTVHQPDRWATVRQQLNTTYFKDTDDLATVSDTIRPYQPGQIYYQGTWWTAKCYQNTVLVPDTVVRVIGLQNITCIVEPVAMPLDNRHQSLISLNPTI
jgi:membrane protein implicated in regulation of membrane protease activity